MASTKNSTHRSSAGTLPPFLRLPAPIRRSIYELLPTKTKHVTGMHGDPPHHENKPVIILALRYIERTIVQTNRFIGKEVEPILEIETMKLGPPRIITAPEYLHLVPRGLRYVRQTQNEFLWQRLRFSDEEREECEDNREWIDFVMWSRIANLQLCSLKKLELGVFVGQDADWGIFLDHLEDAAADIADPRWGDDASDCSRPRFEVVMEFDPSWWMMKEQMTEQTVRVLAKKGIEVCTQMDEWVMRDQWGLQSFSLLFRCREVVWKWIPVLMEMDKRLGGVV